MMSEALGSTSSLKKKKILIEPDMVANVCNPSTQEAKAGAF
jgi:hypothetical protein